MKWFAFACLFLSQMALASENITLKTARGSEVHVTTHIPQGSNLPAIVIAPGQSCNSKGPIFETLGQAGQNSGVAIIRFEWGYCNSNPAVPTPSPDLKNEIDDYQTVLQYAKTLTMIDKNKITLAGKSLGSLAAYAVFAQEKTMKTLVLLTPVCTYTTDDDGKPLPKPQSVCEESYPKIKEDTRSILMSMGNADSLCILPYLYDFLKDSKGNIETIVVGGDHGFRIYDSEKKVDQVKTANNINTAIQSVLNWKAIHE